MYLEHPSLSRECPKLIACMYFKVKIQKVPTVVNAAIVIAINSIKNFPEQMHIFVLLNHASINSANITISSFNIMLSHVLNQSFSYILN